MFVPMHIHSHYSFDSGMNFDSIVDKLKEHDYKSCTLTDHGTMCGAVDFNLKLIEKDIKPIIGVELYTPLIDAAIHDKDNRKNLHMVCLAKNKDGFKELCKMTSRSNHPEVYYYKPRLDIERLKEYGSDNLMWFTGHPGSLLFNVIRNKEDDGYHRDAVPRGVVFMNRMKDYFGEDNVFIEIQRVCWEDNELSDILTEIGYISGVKCVACIDAHYASRSDAKNQRLLLASSLQTTLKKWRQKLGEGSMSSFFEKDYYHIPSPEELKVHTQEELDNNYLLGELCESYSLKEQPSLPRFKCPDNLKEAKHLRNLCDNGWRNLKATGFISQSKYKEYENRVDTELNIISEYDLDGYFLIVQDFIKWAESKGALLGAARGSAGGSLVSYLTGITKTDPITNGLLFSRFLNKGRFTKDNIEYPDVDIDFPKEFRAKVIEYVGEKYGKECVAQVATYGTLKGSGAIQEVLRMHEVASYGEIVKISKLIPNPDSISDQLQEKKEKSVIRFTLKYLPTLLEDYCTIDKEGVFHGDYASYFEQAIELEGTIKSQGIHAAGVIISPTILENDCPMIKSKDGHLICGLDMDRLKDLGKIKFDFLGIATLSALMDVNIMLGRECTV